MPKAIILNQIDDNSISQVLIELFAGKGESLEILTNAVIHFWLKMTEK